MYRIVFEVQLRGLYSEVECLTKLHEHVSNMGRCVGSTTTYVCFFDDVVLKVVPRTEEGFVRSAQPIYGSFQQSVPVLITVEGESVRGLSRVVEAVYLFAKSCGLMIRLLE